MIAADKPSNEAERLQALFNYEILDTSAEEAFDQLTRLASGICGTPIALISLIDETRQWFKSHHGLDASETPRELAFCAHAIHQNTIFEVNDSRLDKRFEDNPLVTDNPNVIFYAGVPLTNPEGFKLGTLCVIDHKPSRLNELQKSQLDIIAQQVITQLELRKNNNAKEKLFSQLMSLTKKTEQKNAELDAFSTRTAHDIKGPISRILHLATFCIDDIEDRNYNQAILNCKSIIHSCKSMGFLVHDIFALSRADISVAKAEVIDIKKLISESLDTLDISNPLDVAVNCHIDTTRSFSSEAIRLRQIIYNLISNGIKYANAKHKKRWVNIAISDSSNRNGGISIEVKDNGIGIPPNMHAQVFTMFERFNPEVSEGTGLGLAIVKKHVDSLGGTITFSSDDSGTVFNLILPDASCAKHDH